jgi:hypothetical protein
MMQNLEVTYTDTFGGEANYSWVRRDTFQIKAHASRRAIVRKAKALMGLTGDRCRVENYGDYYALYPYNACTVLFINFKD